jgi:hypothetical protein
VLFDALYDVEPFSLGFPNYDVSVDGQFLMVRRGDDASGYVVVDNWFEELKRLVPIP